MRKIEERMIDAVLKGKNWKENNTQVCVNAAGGRSVYLHGNRIGWYNVGADGNHTLHVSFCGWHTRTTLSRVNALCGALKGCRPFSIRSGQLQSDPVHAVRLGDGAFNIYGVP